MKILLIGFTKIRYMPYMHFYLDQIDLTAHDVHVLFWNRDKKKDDKINEHITYHELTYYQEDEVAKINKIKGFLIYRSFALKTLKKGKFDFVIVMHSLPGILIERYLLRNFSGKYIFDYRDQTYEKFSVFRKCVDRLVENSYATFVSSDAFRKILPSVEKIYTSHNFINDSLLHRYKMTEKNSSPIRIAFWGFIRHEGINKQIISSLANDERFELHYYGREQATAIALKKHAAAIGARNIFFHGEYQPEDRYSFAKETDIIHNIYSNTEPPFTVNAMGNKYYDGLIFCLPQLCITGSFMGDAVMSANIGLACDPYQSDFADNVWAYYQDLEIDLFSSNCEKELDRVMKEHEQGSEIIKKGIKGGGDK